ncbi:peptidylprolyl isomerase, FKBP-type [Mycobacteroides abscessus M94]|nr:peptidylprolyl isomerase, FKBP-type [Mycobacteroides abscessus M94]
MTAPFSVAETQVHTLQAGSGPIVGDLATVSVCYMGVNGRDGSVFDSSYTRGTPAQFPLGGVVPGFKKAIAVQEGHRRTTGRVDRRCGNDLRRRLSRRSAQRWDPCRRHPCLRDQGPQRHELIRWGGFQHAVD